jgi:phosphoribosylglycinamide formyltransferase 1
MQNIAILASGSGSNAEKIVEYFDKNEQIKVKSILTNNPSAGVIERANRLGIGLVVFDRTQFKNGDVLAQLAHNQIDWVVLAGFLWLIPADWVQAFPNRIINIHPALLPKFGGKGMYGSRVHEAVVAAQEIETGITIHFVNEHYDDGAIIFQATTPVLPTDTPDDVAQKIHALEYEFFPKIIEKTILS